MAVSKGKRGKLAKAKKAVGNATSLWIKLRYHYGWHFKHSAVRENAILFESFHGKTMSDSPLHMLLAFLDDPRSEGFDIYYATSIKNLKAHRALAESLGINVEFVAVESWKYVKVLATAKYLVNNSSFPAYFTRRPEQRYIQTWHGTPLKTLGKQMRLGVESMYNVQHNFLQASIVTFPNEFTRDVMMRDYNLNDLYTGKVALLGYPRNRVFFDTESAAGIRQRYGLTEKEVFAYMPTWRGTNNYTVDVSNYHDELMGYLHKIDDVLTDDQLLFVNFHSMVASKIKLDDFNHVFPFPSDEDNYNFLNAADALITDYSSVFFDFSLTRKPVVLFVYDKDQYLEERGMYLDIEDLPFPKARTIDELTNMIQSGSYKTATYFGTDYERDFLAYDSPYNASKALDLLFEDKADGIPLADMSNNSLRGWQAIEPLEQSTVMDVKTACETADPERDIVMFPKGSFNEDKSRLLHDGYRDKFNFIFYTSAYTCTPVEEILGKRTKRGKALLKEREKQRIFPNLNIADSHTHNLYAGEVGTSCIWDEGKLKAIKADVHRKGDSVIMRLDRESAGVAGDIVGIAAIQDRNVIWKRELTADEISSLTIEEPFADLRKNEKFKRGMEAVLLLEGRKASGRGLIPYCIKAISRDNSYPGDAASGLFAPIRYQDEHTGRKDALVPHWNEQGQLALFHGSSREYLSEYLAAFKHAMLDSIKTKGNKATICISLRNGEFLLEDVILRLRSKVDPREITLPYSLTYDGDWLRVKVTLDPEQHVFQEIYWEPFIVVRRYGARGLIPVKISDLQRRMLYMGNQQWRIGQDKVLFTHIAKGSMLSFVYRDYYPDIDTYALRIKEFAAMGLYMATRPYWEHRRIWLVFEKFCKLAQDNGYYFFDYCMSLPKNKRDHVYYVMDKSQPDYERVKAYGGQVIDFMSFRHILYCLAASIYIGSDSKSHLYAWRPKPSYVRRIMTKRKMLFLQHGVTAMKQVDPLFGAHGSSPMTYFLTTSAREQQIVVDHFDYRTNQAPILGFSRWDVLEDCSSAKSPVILLMPTWRPWLEEQSDSLFVKTEYFKVYSSLIQSKELADILERHNATLKFFIHPKLSERLANFDAASGRIQLIPQGSEPLNQIMMESNMLITDYSSVCWDMLYMDKPVVFYQFDQDLYESTVGSYVNLDEDLPGDVCKDERSAVEAVARCAERGFALTPEQKTQADGWFAYKDTNNRKRTFNFVIDRGF